MSTPSPRLKSKVRMLFSDSSIPKGDFRVKYMTTDVGGVVIVDIEPDRDDRVLRR